MTAAEATAIARIGAAVASGEATRLVAALDLAVDLVEPGAIEEYILQSYLFAGFPRTINAFFTWQGWAARDGRRRGERRSEPCAPEAWRTRGERLCRLIYGADYEALQHRLARLHPELAEWTLIEGYGKVLARPGPDPARRELAAVGALVALAAERQLSAHLRGALYAGVDPATLRGAVETVAAEHGREPLAARLLAALEERR